MDDAREKLVRLVEFIMKDREDSAEWMDDITSIKRLALEAMEASNKEKRLLPVTGRKKAVEEAARKGFAGP